VLYAYTFPLKPEKTCRFSIHNSTGSAQLATMQKYKNKTIRQKMGGKSYENIKSFLIAKLQFLTEFNKIPSGIRRTNQIFNQGEHNIFHKSNLF